MNKVIFFGANTKATLKQNLSSIKIGEILAKHNYYCIHGGGEGTMYAVTLGIKNVNPTASCCHIIIPEFMMPDTDMYDVIGKKDIIDNIHTRIGMHIKLSEECKYIIVYAGGIGTIHEMMSVLVHWYTKPDDMPAFLICNEDANEWCELLSSLLSPLCIPERDYMITMRKKIFNLTTEELVEVLINPETLEGRKLLMV
jgi:predicted Rossmann-fold nucleotide-binding protein